MSERNGDDRDARDERRDDRDMEDDDRDRKVEEVMDIEKEDAAFVLGRGGSTKRKIARVCGAELELDEHNLTITIFGTRRQTDHAKDYLRFVMQQRTGPVYIDLTERRDDLTVYDVPEDCVGFVMGRSGATLRSLEEEWGTLMFFARTDDRSQRSDEKLCIFGGLRARRGAELKVMSAVEHKHPGYCVNSRGELREIERVKGDDDEDGWECETMLLTEENFSYALGAQGSTRLKLATAAGCVLEYVGRVACMAGYRKERKRAREYLGWLIEQRLLPLCHQKRQRAF